jgi:ribosomal protein S18 acetylase RimI-like enzyme
MRAAVIIRELADTDADAVVDLWKSVGLIRPWNDPYLDIERKKAVQRELFLVAVEGDRLLGAGMAGYDGHRGWVNYLAVRPDARQLGIGRALMAEFERRLLALGCPKVNLQVRAGNDAVLAFYARLGYTEDAVVSLGKRLIPDS